MESGEQAASAIWYVLAIAFVASGLFARRLPMGAVLRMALLWVAIFAGLFGLFKWGESMGLFETRDPAGGSIMVEDGSPGDMPAARTQGQALRVPLASDGHYWVEGMINGTPVRFLIDSGATFTALSENTARATGLNVDLGEPALVMNTANGRVEARRSSIATLTIGPIRASDLPVVVSPAFGEMNVLGMNMLSKLKRWGVEDGAMVLVP